MRVYKKADKSIFKDLFEVHHSGLIIIAEVFGARGNGGVDVGCGSEKRARIIYSFEEGIRHTIATSPAPRYPCRPLPHPHSESRNLTIQTFSDCSKPFSRSTSIPSTNTRLCVRSVCILWKHISGASSSLNGNANPPPTIMSIPNKERARVLYPAVRNPHSQPNLCIPNQERVSLMEMGI